jgi:uncharacterized membrane protein YwaF
MLLAADALAFVTAPVVLHRWSVQDSLPRALCDVALVVAAICWWPSLSLAVGLTYFWADRLERHVPRRADAEASLLSLLGPWPWYVRSASARPVWPSSS